MFTEQKASKIKAIESLLRKTNPKTNISPIGKFTVLLYGKKRYGENKKLVNYQEREQPEFEITHYQDANGETVAWLKTHGLESWSVRMNSAQLETYERLMNNE